MPSTMNNQQQNLAHMAPSNQTPNQSTPAPTQGESPFDLSSFISFPTSNSIGHLPAGNDELYRAFGQGIKSTTGTNTTTSQNQSRPQSSSNSNNKGIGSHNNSGVGVKHPGAASIASNMTFPGNGGQSNPSGLNMTGDSYGLDPAAFHNEVRFQLPAFLNPANSAPAYPNGAEAWSGYGNNSTKALEGMYNQSLAGSGNKLVSGGMNASGGFSSNGNGLGWTNPAAVNGGKIQPPPGPNPGDITMGDGHNDAGGFEQWDNWNFTVDGSKPFMSANFNYESANPNIVQAPYTVSNMPNVQQNNVGPGGPPIKNQSASSSTLLPNSAYPNSSSFASSSRMSFSQDSMRSQSVNNSSFENAFPSSSSDMMAPAAASLIASNGLGGLVNPGTLATTTPSGPNMPGLYSTTGFDIVSVLAKVASRKDPKTVLGPVDCSCSFVVSDVRKFDHPIVYSSPTFSQLTGFDTREIVGRNCRFLQSPDGDVAKGSRRKYTDNVAVAHMKRLLQAGKECQASLINYRKGGTPFINLVTVVPITWDSDEIVYHVGFQVDLVEQPNAILRNMRDGSYQVNYTVQNNPQPPMKPAAKAIVEAAPPASIGISKEMLALLTPKAQAAVVAGGEEVGKSEWSRLVLSNADDFVHVVSLKGQFQYASPSVGRVLEYEPEDLLNKHISDICHPSDIVPVMRELKDATHPPADGRQPQPINLLFRVRRKLSGYIWLESSGRLQVDSGKTKKALILTGRDRTVPAFCWKALDDHGGLSDTDVWAKVSLNGFLLWVSGNGAESFGGRPNDLVGKSFYSFLAEGDDGPPGADGHSSALAVEKAITTSAEGLPKRGATSVRHQVVGLDGKTREVTSNFFAAGSSSTGPITPPSESPPGSDDESRSTVSNISDTLPSQILVQIKLTPNGLRASRATIVHPLSENVFEELDTTRGTSWQYEMHQLKTANRKLKDDILALRNGKNVAVSTEDEERKRLGKKRKTNETAPQPSTDHPTPLHQQTPGFGLAPGQLFKTWT